MSSFDYCHWQDQRCRYEPDHQHCEFHRAQEAGDVAGMLASLTTTLPVGATFSDPPEQLPDGSWRFVIVAQPDSSLLS